MRQSDISFLEKELDTFIDTAIVRVSKSGEMHHRFRITSAQLKEGTDRQRLQEALLDEVGEFFRGAGASAQFDDQRSSFSVSVDLNRVELNSRQADRLNTAIEFHRADLE